MSNVLILNDKKANLLEKNNLNFKDYKYINDKLFPQIFKNASIKTNNAIHFKELKKRSEYDPKVRKYCRELEEKIEKDISYKLSDNYYEQKNKNLKNIFVNKPENYYVKEVKLNKSNKEVQRSKSNLNNRNRSNSSGHRNAKSNSSIKSENSKSKMSSSKNKVRIVTNGTRQGTVESSSVKKVSKIKDKKKSVKPHDSNYEIANSKKEIVENIMMAVEPKNVEQYISSVLKSKSKL